MSIDETDPRLPEVQRVWERYRDLSRFLHSSKIAMSREQILWSSLELSDADAVRISVPSSGGVGTYAVAIGEHLGALQDVETLSGLVLLGTCSLAEQLTRISLNAEDLDRSGITVWGRDALAANGQDLSGLGNGRTDLIEAYATRNLFVHGYDTWTQRAANRVSDAGGTPPQAGSPLRISRRLDSYRAAIKSYMRLTGLTVSS